MRLALLRQILTVAIVKIETVLASLNQDRQQSPRFGRGRSSVGRASRSQ